MQDEMEMLRELGFKWPTPAYIVGAILFGLIGLFAYYYGKRRERRAIKWLGVALMLYPYVVPNTGALYAIGIALSAAAWFYRKE